MNDKMAHVSMLKAAMRILESSFSQPINTLHSMLLEYII